MRSLTSARVSSPFSSSNWEENVKRGVRKLSKLRHWCVLGDVGFNIGVLEGFGYLLDQRFQVFPRFDHGTSRPKELVFYWRKN